jgi:hypothetical protein
LIGGIVLLIGVSVFSFIMGQFIEILMNYKSVLAVGEHKELSKWVSLLARFNNSTPLDKELISKIEDYFNYYWSNNRLRVINSESGQRFMSELPFTVQEKIFIEYMFRDFLDNYKTYLRPPPITDRTRAQLLFQRLTASIDTKHREFLVKFVSDLEPRLYKQSSNELI